MIIADLVARNGRQCPDHIAFVEVRPISKGRKETKSHSKVEKPKLREAYAEGKLTR